MNSMVDIAIYKLKALFKAYHRLAYNFKFIKGSVHNLQKAVMRTLVLDNIECGGKCG